MREKPAPLSQASATHRAIGVDSRNYARTVGPVPMHAKHACMVEPSSAIAASAPPPSAAGKVEANNTLPMRRLPATPSRPPATCACAILAAVATIRTWPRHCLRASQRFRGTSWRRVLTLGHAAREPLCRRNQARSAAQAPIQSRWPCGCPVRRSAIKHSRPWAKSLGSSRNLATHSPSYGVQKKAFHHHLCIRDGPHV